MKHKINTKLIITVFIAFIGVMGALYIFLPKSNFSVTEKRYLAEMPDLTIESLKDGSFSTDFESYLADHTPLRTFYISVNAYFELTAGNNGSNGVYLGKDGYLIEKPFERENRLDINLKRITEFAEKTDIPITLIAVPSKGYIYSDKLPSNAMEYRDDEYEDEINSCAKKADIKTIDLRNVFKNNSENYQLYYKTDHHWTSDGAFLAYKTICKQLGFTIPNKSDYTVEAYHDFYGTSYAKACYTLTKPDDIKLYVDNKNGGKAEVTITDGKNEKKYDNMFFKNRLDENDKYLTFLDGNHGLVTIKTGNNGGKLLVIKDSYAHCLVPFLAENYSEIVMLDLRYYKSGVNELISAQGITDIMFVYSLENIATSRDIILN